VNAEAGAGVDLCETYNVEGYPTFILAKSDGATLERWWGYENAAAFIPTLHAAMQDPTTIEEKRARFARSPTDSDAMKLAMFHETRDEYEDAVRYYRTARDMGHAEDLTMAIFEVVAGGARHDAFSLKDATDAADAALAYEGRETNDIVRVARVMTSLGRKKDDHQVMVPYLEVAMQKSTGVEDVDVVRNRNRIRVDHALFVEHDAAKAVAYRKELLAAGWMEDSEALNDFAWWCFENEVNLEEADEFARRGVALAADGKSKAMILDTLAEICNLRGSCKDAVYFVELAIEADPESAYYPKQRERFQKLLAEQH